MKKILSLLSVLTISGAAVPTTIATSPYRKEEIKLENNLETLNRNKRSVHSFNYGGGNVKVVWQFSWLTCWELEFDDASAKKFYRNFNNYYGQNQSKLDFNEFRGVLTGDGIGSPQKKVLYFQLLVL